MAAEQHTPLTIAARHQRIESSVHKTWPAHDLNHPMSRYTHCAELLLPGDTDCCRATPEANHRCGTDA
jgi:hypothetical protein